MTDFLSPLEPRAFFDTVGLFATGVCVITANGTTGPHGMTANAVTSLSRDPMQIIACIAKRAQMSDYLSKPGARFTINVLRDEQIAISNHFAGRVDPAGSPNFRMIEWDGGPRIEGVLAAIGCEVQDCLPGGDHLIVIGRVVCLHQGIEPHKPLLYFRSRYHDLAGSLNQPAPERADLGDDPQLFFDPWSE